MAIENLHNFLSSYFEANQCDIILDEDGKLSVQLTEKMDELLMNRPFYWHYIRNTRQIGIPMKLTLITSPERQDEEGEWIHFGSPRLHQIFRSLYTQGKMTKLYEHRPLEQRTALLPWLVLNIKISYKGRQKREELLSVGLQLINGAFKTEMMDWLKEMPLERSIPDFCYTITPLIKLRSGYQRIVRYLENYLEAQDFDWAQEAWHYLEQEEELVKYFYKDSEDGEKEEQLQKELKNIEDLYRPNISYEIINGGIFYLTQGTSSRLAGLV